MANNTSQHILNTSANLLGFCLVVITSLHIADKAKNNLVDESTSIVALLLTVSCILSFAAIKARNPTLEEGFEQIADNFFHGFATRHFCNNCLHNHIFCR